MPARIITTSIQVSIHLGNKLVHLIETQDLNICIYTWLKAPSRVIVELDYCALFNIFINSLSKCLLNTYHV